MTTEIKIRGRGGVLATEEEGEGIGRDDDELPNASWIDESDVQLFD
jgi:hypothetical protein